MKGKHNEGIMTPLQPSDVIGKVNQAIGGWEIELYSVETPSPNMIQLNTIVSNDGTPRTFIQLDWSRYIIDEFVVEHMIAQMRHKLTQLQRYDPEKLDFAQQVMF